MKHPAIAVAALVLVLTAGCSLRHTTPGPTLTTPAPDRSTPGAAAAPAIDLENPAIVSLARPDLRRYTVDQLFQTRYSASHEWSPDGRHLAFVTDITGRYNIWVVPSEGGWPRQVTISDQRTLSPRWSPDGQWLAYRSDENMNEKYDLYLIHPFGGIARNLTGTPDVDENGVDWSPDGTQIVYNSNAADPSKYQVHIMEIATGESRPITSAPVSSFYPIWSPDGERVAVSRTDTGSDVDIIVIDVATGEERNLTPHEGEQSWYAADWSPDGGKLLVGSDTCPGFVGYDNVAVLDVETGAVEWLTRDLWASHAGEWAHRGARISWLSNVEGNNHIFVHELDTGETRVLDIPKGNNSGPDFSPDGGRLAYVHTGPTRPTDIWTYHVGTGETRQVTFSMLGGVRSEDLVEPYLVHYPTTGAEKVPAMLGGTVPAVLYVPHNLEADRSAPAIVWIHGGPSGMNRNRFSPYLQYFANNGYVVLAPNPRGSVGYGKEFEDLNNMDWGGGDLADIVAGAKFLETLDYVDPGKIVAAGASYGGYMTLACLTMAPEVWAAGVDIVGPSNLFTLFENTRKDFQEYFKREMGLPGESAETDALLRARSPLFSADRIRVPLLVQQGETDPRVPLSEAEQIVDSIRERGGVVQYTVFENEGHGFMRRESRIRSMEEIVEFLDRVLKGK